MATARNIEGKHSINNEEINNMYKTKWQQAENVLKKNVTLLNSVFLLSVGDGVVGEGSWFPVTRGTGKVSDRMSFFVVNEIEFLVKNGFK